MRPFPAIPEENFWRLWAVIFSSYSVCENSADRKSLLCHRTWLTFKLLSDSPLLLTRGETKSAEVRRRWSHISLILRLNILKKNQNAVTNISNSEPFTNRWKRIRYYVRRRQNELPKLTKFINRHPINNNLDYRAAINFFIPKPNWPIKQERKIYDRIFNNWNLYLTLAWTEARAMTETYTDRRMYASIHLWIACV